MTDMNALIELQQSLTFLGQIGGLALALLGAGLAAVLSGALARGAVPVRLHQRHRRRHDARGGEERGLGGAAAA